MKGQEPTTKASTKKIYSMQSSKTSSKSPNHKSSARRHRFAYHPILPIPLPKKGKGTTKRMCRTGLGAQLALKQEAVKTSTTRQQVRNVNQGWLK